MKKWHKNIKNMRNLLENIKKELFYLIFLIIILKKIQFYKFKNNIMLKTYFKYKYKNYYL
jgi:hypothetical protein